MLNENMLNKTAPPITNTKVGSQFLEIVKNPITFDYLHIPLITKPAPKIVPNINYKIINFIGFVNKK